MAARMARPAFAALPKATLAARPLLARSLLHQSTVPRAAPGTIDLGECASGLLQPWKLAHYSSSLH